METETAVAVLAPRGYRVNEGTLLRHVRMEPYLPGKGPTFDLVTWDTGRFARTGQCIIGAALFSSESEDPIFHCEEIGVPPSQAIDSDDATRGALGWYTLRPGDTDPDFFAEYTEAQLAFASAHAESLSLYAMEACDDPPAWDADLLDH